MGLIQESKEHGKKFAGKQLSHANKLRSDGDLKEGKLPNAKSLKEKRI